MADGSGVRSTPEDDEADDLARLQQFLRGLLVVALGYASIEGIGAVLISNIRLGLSGLIVLSVVVSARMAMRWAQMKGVSPAALLVGYVLLGQVLINTVILPFGAPAALLVPALAVAAVLPYVSGRPLRIFISIAFITEVLIAGYGGWIEPQLDIPKSLRMTLYVGAISAATALTFVVLLQFSSRLRLLLGQLREAVRARDDFLGQASHELRTPLTSLKLQLQRLESEVGHLAPDGALPRRDLERRLALLSKQANRLATLISALLDVSRMSAGRLSLELEDVDLAEVARDVADRLREQALAAGCSIQLEAGGPPIVGRWDRLRLEQVITNLLTNAITYGTGKPIEVGFAEHGGDIVLRVRDQGIGISPEDQRRIFQRFERAVSSRNYGGVGLGLWIVQQIVTAHGGQISVESDPGQGATFTVSLPRSQAATGATGSTTSALQ